MPPLPDYHLSSVADTEAFLGVGAPRHARLHGVDCIRDSCAFLGNLVRKWEQLTGGTFGDLRPLHRVIRLGNRLRAARDHLLFALLNDPGNVAAHRRLRNHADAIRRFGRDEFATTVVRALALRLGNRLKKIANQMILGKRSSAWFVARQESIGVHIRQVYEMQYIPLEDF